MSVSVSRLSNGLHVVSHDMAQLETVAIGLWVRAGSRDEAEAENGIAHLIEHMAFKGTGRRSAQRIAEEIEAAGGDINAATAMESTAYYARVLKDDWRLALDVIADIIADPVFDPTELKREKNVILQEIGAARDTPDDIVFDLAQGLAWPDHALGRTILGLPRQVRRFRRDHIHAYREGHYAPGRMVVAAAGRIDHDALVDEAERLLGGLGGKATAHWSPPAFAGGVTLSARKLDQTHQVLAFPAVSYRDRDIYTAQLLSGLLGGGMSSRLFQEVREKRGLCYSVFTYASAYEDCGLFTFYAATAPALAGELLAVASDVLQSASAGVTEAELDRARAQLKAGLLMSLESSAVRVEQIARQTLFLGQPVPLDELAQRIDAIDAERVRETLAGLIGDSPLTLAAVGPVERLATAARITERLGSTAHPAA